MSTDQQVRPVSVRSVSLARRARHLLRAYVSERQPYLRFARYRYPGPSPRVIGPDTELVIDGYTRCASTFAVYALQLSQDRPVRLAHHLHAPAHLIRAARTGVPALALIREPRGALLSQVIREPGVRLRDALVAYARFYECLLPYRDRLVVADFHEVISDFGAVTTLVNARFGTSFTPFAPTRENVRRCFDLIALRGTLSPALLGFESGQVGREELVRERRRLAGGDALRDAADAWVPSSERNRSKAVLLEEWHRADMAAPRERALSAYRTFVGEEER